MQMLTVCCARPGDEAEGEPRVAIVIAHDFVEAEKLCLGEYGSEGFERFEAGDVVPTGSFAGPACVLGYTGQRPPFNWKI